MKGTIKFLDGKTAKWGFIVPDEAGADVHFQVEDFDGQRPTIEDAGRGVEFDLETVGEHREAKNIRLGPPTEPRSITESAPARSKFYPGEALKQWAYVPYVPFTHRDGSEYTSMLEYLAKIALSER
jgi:cold shock CspA family protein